MWAHGLPAPMFSSCDMSIRERQVPRLTPCARQLPACGSFREDLCTTVVLCCLASAPTEHVRREDEPVARERSSRRTWTGEPGGVMMAEVGASRRGGVVLQRTAGNSDLAWEDHRAAVP